MKKTLQKGIAQIVILGIMGLLAIVLPVATKLVQENQENRSQAAGSCYDTTHIGNKSCSGSYPTICQPTSTYGTTVGWVKTGTYCEHGCLNGKCNVCKPDTTQCTSGKIQTCSSSGSWSSPVSCPTGQTCPSGKSICEAVSGGGGGIPPATAKCLIASLVGRDLTPTEKACGTNTTNKTYLYTCNAENDVAVTHCPGTCSDGACVSLIQATCIGDGVVRSYGPGAANCGAGSYVINPAPTYKNNLYTWVCGGTGYSSKTCTAPGNYGGPCGLGGTCKYEATCLYEGGSAISGDCSNDYDPPHAVCCKPAPAKTCNPTATQCKSGSTTVKQTCNSTGTQWVDSSCPSGQICVKGGCYVSCTSEGGTCGTTLSSDCPGGVLYAPGSSDCLSNFCCKPARVCSSTLCNACNISNCSANNCIWNNGTGKCLNGDNSLAQATCKGTSETVKRCVGTYLYTCIAGSPQWTGGSPENCSNGCSNNSCNQCKTGTTYCAADGNVYGCPNTTWVPQSPPCTNGCETVSGVAKCKIIESKCATFGNLSVGITINFSKDNGDLCESGNLVSGSLKEVSSTTSSSRLKYVWQCGGSGYTTKNCEWDKRASDVLPEKFCSGTCLPSSVCTSRIGTTIPLDTKVYKMWSNCDDLEVCCINMTSGSAKCGVSGTLGVGETLIAGDDLCELGDDSEFKINSTGTGWTWKCGGGNFTSVPCSALKNTPGAKCAQIRDDAFCISTYQCTGTNLGQSDCEKGKTCCWGQTKINGVCGNSKLDCKAGTADDSAVADTSSYYKWICKGINGGINSGTCQYPKDGGGGSTSYTLTVNPLSLNLNVGTGQTVTPILTPARSTEVFAWSTNNSAVATVYIPNCSDKLSAKCEGTNYWLEGDIKRCTKCAGANFAYIKAIKPGTAMITVLATPSNATTTMLVTVTDNNPAPKTCSYGGVTYAIGKAICQGDKPAECLSTGAWKTFSACPHGCSGQGVCNPAPPVITGITLSPDPLKMKVGQKGKVSAVTVPAGLPAVVRFESGDASVASVDMTGLVTAKKVGENYIIGKVEGTSIQGKIRVIVEDGVPPVCVANTYKCESNNLMVCKSDGSAWQLSKECKSTQKCNATTKTCDNSLCTPNTFRCTDNDKIVEKCKSDGSAWELKARCNLGYVCNAKTGACDKLPTPCTPNAYKCESNNLMICGPDGLRWIVSKECKSTQKCNATTKTCDNIPTCTPNTYKCESNNLMVCNSKGNGWDLSKKCTTNQKCNATTKTCDALEPSDAKVSFKMAFAGIKPGATCINDYLIKETRVDLDIANVPTNKYDAVQTSFEVVEGEEDADGNQIFKVSTPLDKEKFGSVNNFNYVKVKGPWHLKRRMCQDNQSKKLPENTKCDIDFKVSNSKVYNFSNYTLLAGDIYNGPDGVINVLDLNYIKLRLDPGAFETNICGVEGDLNMDRVVNSYDLNLVKDSLTERDDE